jgi:translation initiation factor 3 subunit F
MMVGEHALANMFQEIKVEITLTESEKICLYHMTRGQPEDCEVEVEDSTQVVSSIPSQPANLLSSMELLVTLLDKISAHVDAVVAGSKQADPAVGMLLADVLGSLKVVDPVDFQAFFADKMQDMLMVSYISSLTATQLAVAERLICLL